MDEKMIKYHDRYAAALFDDCLPFWQKNGWDNVNGGVYTCLDRQGALFSTDKSVWMQGRCAWTFARLYNTYGDRCAHERQSWLAFAKSCLDFANKFCFDTDGRMFFTVTADGSPIRKRRYWYSEVFYCMACAEYATASGDRTALIRARETFERMLALYGGAPDPYTVPPKSYRKNRALAQPMILLNAAAVLMKNDGERRDYYMACRKSLACDVLNYFYKPEYGALLETVDANGAFYSDIAEYRIVNPGHDIEAGWFLLDYAATAGDKNLLATAEKIINQAFERGWDEEYGGISYFVDLLGKPLEAYEHDMKLWWPHNEAIIAFLKLYRLTGKQQYLQLFEQVDSYAFEHFADPEYGEWYGYLRRDGKPTEPACKGQTYKGPFHVPRMLTEAERLLSR